MSVTLRQATFPSAAGGADIAYAFFEPVGVPVRGVVQLCHDMSEYVLRYGSFARVLCPQGFAVCGNDHLGHGSSIKKVSERGHFANQGGADCLIQDAMRLGEIAGQRYPGAPRFLLGIGMGALVARNAAARDSVPYAGMILVGSIAAAGPKHLAIKRMALSLTKTKGERHRSQVLFWLLVGAYDRRMREKREPSPFAWLTSDQTMQDLYMNDEKCGFPLTAGGYADLVTLLQAAASKKTLRDTRDDLPVLIASGEDDVVSDFGRDTGRLRQMLTEAGLTDVKTLLYPGARHDLLGEHCREQVAGDIVSWLEGHLV